MDESWRMRMGMGMASKSSFPRRKSTEGTHHQSIFGECETLDPEDFNDVFGGPPRSVLSRQFSAGGGGGEFATSSPFYEEIFRTAEEKSAAGRIGRSLPEFRIPASRGSRRCEEFYSDIFRWDEDVRRSRSRSKSKASSKPMSKSKSTSSSVLSSEELSPLRHMIGADDDISFSSFASKLRPINVPSRWYPAMMHDEYSRQQGMPASSFNRPSYAGNKFMENEFMDNFRSSYSGFSRRVPSPETISLEPNSYGSIRISADDLEINSPSSVVSSLCQDQEAKACKIQAEVVVEELGTEQEEDESMSSYVIEINSDSRDKTGDQEMLGNIDEAIAWAKERLQPQNSEKDCCTRQDGKEHSGEVEEMPTAHHYTTGDTDGSPAEHTKPSTWETREEREELDKEVELMDENIRLWSFNKESNIRLLLSTLHHILWPNSGWCPIPITNLIEGSQVKKAYQKARLCLHPDKLQQRGATVSQKYVADKAFSILQDAWDAFICQDIISS